MVTDLVFLKGNTPITNSLVIAEGTDNEHRAVLQLIGKYEETLKRWGKIQFSNLKSKSPLVGRPTRVAYLNEQQAIFLVMLLSNTETVVAFKAELVEHFFKIRESVMSFEDLISAFEPAKKNKCVYVLEMDNGTVKIGVSKNFRKRSAAINTGSGIKIVDWAHSDYIPAAEASKIESACHRFFKQYQTAGEFFKVPYNAACAKLEEYTPIIERLSDTLGGITNGQNQTQNRLREAYVRHGQNQAQN